MKKKPTVILSQMIPGKLKRRDIIENSELYIVTYQGKPITIAVIDEDITHWATPRYANTLYSQRASAENACARLNQEFATDAFEVKQVKL